MTEIIKASNVDPGELLLETVKNAQYISSDLQKSIAHFMEIWSAPIMTVTPIGENINNG